VCPSQNSPVPFAIHALTRENRDSLCWLPAACFLSPQDTFETAVVLKVITLVGSKFSVRSGGHNPNPGFASIDGSGVLIDIRKLTSLSLSSDSSVVSAGAGNTWGNVYNLLDPKGRFAVGTRYTAVGVSGSTQGGI
jgi:FAD/FMN-containing dehydrogenase